MRMRRKKHLEEKLSQCSNLISFPHVDSDVRETVAEKEYIEDVFAMPSVKDGKTSVTCRLALCGGSRVSLKLTDGGTTLAFYPPGRTGEYTVPSGTTKIERNAFMRCGVTKVNLPEGLTTIGSAAFMSCQQMEEVNLPETLTSIGWEAFYNCTSLTEVTIPAAVNDVGSMAFEYCSELQYATFNGDAPESFGYSVFYGCKSGFKIRYYYEYHSTWDPDENNMWYSGSE